MSQGWYRLETEMAQIKSECKIMAKNLEATESNPEIEIVRYEDISMEPIKYSERIYDFIEMELTQEMREYLNKSTKTQDQFKDHAKDMEWMQAFTTNVSF